MLKIENILHNSYEIINKLDILNKNYNNTEILEITRDWHKYVNFINDKNDNKVNLVVFGLVNAGKSSLLNSIFDKKELFLTAPVRETKSINTKVWENFSSSEVEVVFSDTPGIDVFEEDEILAEDAICNYHFIIFVHNINLGELDAKEIKYLLKLAKHNPELNERIIFIFTQIDLKSEEELENIISKIKRQLKDYLKIKTIRFFPVSSTRYFSGIEKRKELLIVKSNIRDLRQFLESEVISKKELLKNIPIQKYNFLKNKTKEVLLIIDNNFSNEIQYESSDLEIPNKKLSSFKERWEEVAQVTPEYFKDNCLINYSNNTTYPKVNKSNNITYPKVNESNNGAWF